MLVIPADELILKIDDPFSRSLYFTDQRQTYFAVAANFLCLVQIGVFGERNLDRISGGKSYSECKDLVDTAKAATSSGIQRRRALQSLLARNSNESLLVRRSCESFASCGPVYFTNLLIGKIKTTAICVPTSCGRDRHHTVSLSLGRLASLGFAAAQI